MLIKVLAVGKLKDRALHARCEEYLKWISTYGKAELQELPDSNVQKEGQAILKALEKERGCVVVLTEEGREFTSEKFAKWLGSQDCKVTFVIGGPYGLAPEVKQRATLLWSLSQLTFTHEMARFFLAEQLFRAGNILHGGKYHNP